jgi:Na+/H+ antiporter NhaA
MTKSALKKFAGVLWIIPSGILLYRGSMWIKDVWVSESPEANSHSTLIIYIILGLLMGGAKGKFVLSKSAKRNMDRIDRLPEPVKAWQVFPVILLPLIGLMVAFGMGLQALAKNKDVTWIGWGGCAAIYIGIGAALFVSSFLYFKKKNESN